MTYQNLGYWVGQANDSSTGNHPTGWSSGQRWSETAGEWQTMFNTEYSAARDVSAGQPGKPSGTQHPTGWASGQLWSVTATQWNGMWGTEWTAARDNSGGQTPSGGTPGIQHPTGYAAGQLWSVTAQQWSDMWGTEWVSARDAANQTYSYPGQPAYAVFWSQTAQYWKGQADYYWGPSRTWNSGSTWEQLYNNYVGYYNDMVNQRDTWQARANQAWTGGTYGNGELWSTAYYRVVPLNTPYVMSQAFGNHASWDRQQVGAFQVDRNGYWHIVMIGRVTGAGGSVQYWLNIDGLGDVAYGDADSSGDSTIYATIGLNYLYNGILGPGNWIRTLVARADNNVSGTTYAYFIPTPSYAH